MRGKGLGFGVQVSRFQPTVADEYLQRLPIFFSNSCEGYLFQKQTHTSVRFRSKQKLVCVRLADGFLSATMFKHEPSSSQAAMNSRQSWKCSSKCMPKPPSQREIDSGNQIEGLEFRV